MKEKPLANQQAWDARRRARLDALKKMIRDERERGYSVTHRVPCATPGCFGHRWVSNHCIDDIADTASGARRCPWCEDHDNIPRQVCHWRDITPSAFRTGATATDPARLPAKLLAMLSDAMLDGFPRPIYIHGATGAGKSRTLFCVLGALALRSPVRPRIIRGGDLRASFFRSYGDETGATARLVDELIAEELLVFDDFGQDELTSTMLADLWRIIDTRTANADISTIFLSNYAPADLGRRYAKSASEHALASMIRRIRDFCLVVPAC